jgi:hypothetical protein
MLRCFSDELNQRPSFEEIIGELLGYAKETTKDAKGGAPDPTS